MQDLHSASFHSTYAFFVSLINRLLPIGIVLYRYIYVCRVSWVQTAFQRKVFHFLISGGIFGVSISLTAFSFVYREESFLYLKCLGKEEVFYSKYEDTGVRLLWLLPLYHPFHLLSILAFFSYIFLVPVGYFCIYTFRKRLDSETRGLSERSRKVRKTRNLVTTRYNLLIWICEFISGFVIIFPGSNVFVILYFFLPSTLSPIMYYLGIEVNRQAMKKHVKEMFLELNRKGKIRIFLHKVLNIFFIETKPETEIFIIGQSKTNGNQET